MGDLTCEFNGSILFVAVFEVCEMNVLLDVVMVMVRYRDLDLCME
jgi:hypothetical protein